MATHRMIPPDGGATTKVNGRSYICAAGASIDVPDFDGQVLEGNGWSIAAGLGVGTTAARPANLTAAHKGQSYHDSTLGKNILWNGKRWVDPTNGATV